jgi:hypothetical protein
MLLTLKQNELEFDKMSDDATELVHVTGESRISVNIQQITSRFQGIQSTAKVNFNLNFNEEFTCIIKKKLYVIKKTLKLMNTFFLFLKSTGNFEEVRTGSY